MLHFITTPVDILSAGFFNGLHLNVLSEVQTSIAALWSHPAAVYNSNIRSLQFLKKTEIGFRIELKEVSLIRNICVFETLWKKIYRPNAALSTYAAVVEIEL